MRVAVCFVAAGLASCLAADSGKWVAPLAPRHVEPPRAGPHPIDAFLGTETPVVPDAVFLRRAYLDLWGLLPSPQQADDFERDTAKDKRERLIGSLLANQENYSSHWITFWNDLLRNEEGVVYHGERKSITPWLKKALAANMPYDQFVARLLNPAQPGDPEGFLTGVTWRGVVNASELPPMQAAQNSAQIFLGINLKCNSCHDSFISTWKLKDAYGLASFFSDGPLELVRCDVKQGKTAETKFLFPELGPVPQGMTLPERRAAAARLFTAPENGRLARTYVNRIWAQLFGQGLVANVDDMAARPSNPDLLDWLASDFAAHGYDTQYLLNLLMTSRAYQSPSAPKRRISAEEFIDAVSAMTGEWRVLEDRSTKSGVYAREWRFKSSPLSRALGRPIRDQVTTVRLTQPTTLQALELVNGATLSTLLSRGALRLQDRLPPAPASLFDSGSIRGAKSKPQVDIDISGVNELWLLMTDVDSYDPAHVKGGFVGAELSGPAGTQRTPEIASLALPAEQKIDLRGKGYTRFRATVALDVASTTSDVNGAVRFFVFGAKPDYTRLLPVHGAPPVEAKPAAHSSREELVRWLYRYAYTREPSQKEMALAAGEESLEDMLWAMVMSPEFQYIR